MCCGEISITGKHHVPGPHHPSSHRLQGSRRARGGFHHRRHSRMETCEFATPSAMARKFNPSVTRNPRVNVLLPGNRNSGKRYSVLHLFHDDTIYGAPKARLRQDLISADNPTENLESYRNEHIFLVSGDNRDIINFQTIGIISEVRSPHRAPRILVTAPLPRLRAPQYYNH